MVVLITGANGMLGEECVRLLSGTHDIIACDVHDTLQYSDSIVYEKLNIMNEQLVLEIIKQRKPQFVVNCAAYTDVDGAERDRKTAWDVNAGGVQNLVSSLSKTGGKLVHISTDYVFDGSAGPYAEDEPPKPINYYGQTKLDSENLVKDSQIPWAIIRTNVLFGNTKLQKASFVRWVVEKLSRFETISIVNDQFGNPTWSYGLAQVINRIIEIDAKGLYHYAGKDYINRFEFALKIAGIFGLDPTLIRTTTTRALNQLAPRPFKAGLTCEKTARELQVDFYSIIEALKMIKETA